MRWFFAIALLSAIAVNGGASAASPIEGKWRFEDITGAAGFDPAKTEFIVASAVVALSVGCNRMRADITLADSSLTFGPVAATRMLCPPPLADLELKAGLALEATRRFEIGGDGGLRLLDADGGLLARLSRAK